jgi:hypothetical protein
MKTLEKLLKIFVFSIGLYSCVGPEGPIGPVGPQGQPGINILGKTYEVDVNFTSQNDYIEVFNFPQRLEDSAGVLVYRLVGVENNRDIWRLLPQNYFFEEGVLIYNFDYSVADFAIFLDGPIAFSSLGDQWRINQVFRVIVVPSDFPNGRIDYSDYDTVTSSLGIEESDFVKMK